MTSAANPPITTFKDILDAMEQRPELLEAMRQHIIDQELMQIPAAVRELAQTLREFIASTNARFQRIESDISDLKANQARMQADITQMQADIAQIQADIIQIQADIARMDATISRIETDISSMKGTLGRLLGNEYERKATQRAIRLAIRRLGMTNPVVIHASAIPHKTGIYQMADQAILAGRITADQSDDLDEADIIIHDQDADTYALAEISITLDAADAARARRRADILSGVTQTPVNAALIGAQALDQCRAAAQQTGVTIILLPE